MAEGYQTEEEQIEQIKKWWKENGISIIATVLVAIVGVYGWQGWQTKQQEDIDTASALYQNMLTASQGSNGVISGEQRATSNHLAETLKKDFPDSAYAQFAGLYKAKIAVDSDELVKAEAELRWVLASKPIHEIALQTNLRLARVLYAQDKYAEALALLGDADSGHAPSYEEAKGDIYLAQGDKAKSILAYQKALELNQQGESPTRNPLLEMKIQQLKSEQGAVAEEPSAEEAVSAPEGDA